MRTREYGQKESQKDIHTLEAGQKRIEQYMLPRAWLPTLDFGINIGLRFLEKS